MNEPHADLWGLLTPDCSPQDHERIAAAALQEIQCLQAALTKLIRAAAFHADLHPACEEASEVLR